MQKRSRAVSSNQPGPHQDVSRRVARALAHPLQKPIAAHNQVAFDQADAWLDAQAAPLILDSGCGVGLSTRRLAATFPDHAVIGVDRSEDRLGREHGEPPGNALLMRADLVDFWRLAQRAGWAPSRHYLLYPNPYPKALHLGRRWHGHPVFPTLLALGGRLELRSNWKTYVEEFAQAVAYATGKSPDVAAHDPNGDYLTPFEAKYDHSGQALWRLTVNLERV
ncbi:SAM-dependent methyltransferase [Halomonas vilamensis]|uniref:tRNA (guanine(46)-N(7))-methyltransferase n=1 Tax=Vreelandella vilamensis TaxID=531309 RepID=A0ABU1GZE2_9GAMM|nr:SAM-dependent methyltransferase [Halomonas vilamensis]MDR5897427.1 SAM-dependent methyltransferase [Halomonas vilamensis]